MTPAPQALANDSAVAELPTWMARLRECASATTRAKPEDCCDPPLTVDDLLAVIGESAVTAPGKPKQAHKQKPHICPDDRRSEAAAAEYLGCSTATLRNWRAKGTGPSYVLLGRVWYFTDDLDLWIQKHYRDPNN